MSKYMQTLRYQLRGLVKSGEIDPEGSRELQKLLDKIEHALATKKLKDLSLLIDRFCEAIIVTII